MNIMKRHLVRQHDDIGITRTGTIHHTNWIKDRNAIFTGELLYNEVFVDIPELWDVVVILMFSNGENM